MSENPSFNAADSFPRLCAHRGLSRACPENTLPSFGAALSLGVSEIELDLWLSQDGVPVVCHDKNVERTTSGSGDIPEMKFVEIRKLDAGIKHGAEWSGVRIPRFEEVVDFVGSRTVLNVHIKDPGPGGRLVALICDFLRARGLAETAYIAGKAEVLEIALRYAGGIARACLDNQDDPEKQIDAAEKYQCRRVQFGRNVTVHDIAAAREAGFICNLFYSDDPQEAGTYIDRGIDVILTNCANYFYGFDLIQGNSGSVSY